jgi:hypothetical protein
LLSTLTGVAGVAHRNFTDQEGSHSLTKARFSLGERLPISPNAPVENNV